MKRQSNYWKNSPEFWIFLVTWFVACDIGIFCLVRPTDLFSYYLLGPLFAAVIPSFVVALVHKILRERGWNLLAVTVAIAVPALIAGWFSHVWTPHSNHEASSIAIGAAIYGAIGAGASRLAGFVASKRQTTNPNKIAGVFD